ncbi:putative membrane protein, partial [Candidatus Phytoplasma oryzae]
KNFLLKKIVFISLLLSTSFIIEFIFNKFILNVDCCYSFIKLELLPLILIGFLFGFKFSFFSNLLYILIHVIIEFSISAQKHGLFFDAKNNYKFLIGILMFIFILPYLACSISGLSLNLEKKYFIQKKNFILIFIIISIIQIISYFLFYLFFYNNLSSNFYNFINNFYNFFHIKQNYYNPIILFLIYYLISISLTNIIIGFILYYFLKYIYQENKDFLIK